MTLVAGLTGTIGAGKTAAARIFAELGAAVVDADELAREAASQPDILDAIECRFRQHGVVREGVLDRRALGELVFRDSEKRRALEQIVHPRVHDLFRARLAALQSATPFPLILYVVPLLFETGRDYPELHAIIVVTAPEQLCLERIILRDGCSRELAERKLAAQLPAAEKVRRADYVIVNDGNMDQLRRQVRELFTLLTTRNHESTGV